MGALVKVTEGSNGGHSAEGALAGAPQRPWAWCSKPLCFPCPPSAWDPRVTVLTCEGEGPSQPSCPTSLLLALCGDTGHHWMGNHRALEKQAQGWVMAPSEVPPCHTDAPTCAALV